MTLPTKRGYLTLRRLSTDETRWFSTIGREFGLWYVTLHGFGLSLCCIGPFEFGRD